MVVITGENHNLVCRQSFFSTGLTCCSVLSDLMQVILQVGQVNDSAPTLTVFTRCFFHCRRLFWNFLLSILPSTGMGPSGIFSTSNAKVYLIKNSQAVKKGAAPKKAMVKKDVKYKVAAKKWL